MFIKFSKQIGKSLAKIINTIVNSRPAKHLRPSLLRESFLGLEGNSEFCQISKMELFAEIVKNEKSFTIFVKSSILDV